ncbi:MAG TPA: HAMP domain-containing sensor histidine kinase [Candidatus Cybelea sp.]|nr:HAMP domain-containing sensor histidine kinase [Candidatus Cybelea sp.]
MIARTAILYLCVFVCVLAALSIGAYEFVAREYASLLAPALGTPEGVATLRTAMQRVALTIAEIDAPLVIVVAIASYVLARAAIAPLVAARERERRFAADAAHELRSPLTAIAAVAQAARAGAAEQSRISFETIARSALEASAVVTDLLTLARDPARRALHCEPVDLAAIVTIASRDTQPVADARNVRLDVAPASAIVDGDERRLRELSVNLLDNAIRHARRSVRISSRRAGRLCEIVVEDDGDGIPPSERERVFERFYRRANDGSGTGLGLPIVRWIAYAHGGAVEVDRSSDGGARFVAAFPSRES